MAFAGKAEQNPGKQALRMYLSDISRIPLLSLEEEQELGRRIREGDEEAVKKMIEGNLRFVVKIAKRFRGLGVSFLDLINEGNLGLIEAARRFDPSKEVRFISYAVWWIRQSIFSALSNLGRPVRLPIKVNAALYKLNRLSENGQGQRRTVEELASDAGMSQNEIRSILATGGEGVPLQQSENGRTLEEQLPAHSSPSAEEEAVRRSIRSSLNKIVRELGTREQEILRLRYGLDDDRSLTLQQVGDKIGLSRERVRQIEEKTIRKLRENHKTISLISKWHQDQSQAC